MSFLESKSQQKERLYLSVYKIIQKHKNLKNI